MPSSVIKAFNYRPEAQELDVQFVSGRRYIYHDVPAAVANELLSAGSKGEYFNREIRDTFRFTRDVKRGKMVDALGLEPRTR